MSIPFLSSNSKPAQLPAAPSRPVAIPSNNGCVNAVTRIATGTLGLGFIVHGAKRACGLTRPQSAAGQPAALPQTEERTQTAVVKGNNWLNPVATSAVLTGLEIAGGAALLALACQRA